MVEPMEDKIFGKAIFNNYYRLYSFPRIFNIAHTGFEILIVIICFAFLSSTSNIFLELYQKHYLCILKGAQDHQSFYLINMYLREVVIASYFFQEILRFEFGQCHNN